jgi:hypothetical protein
MRPIGGEILSLAVRRGFGQSAGLRSPAVVLQHGSAALGEFVSVQL